MGHRRQLGEEIRSDSTTLMFCLHDLTPSTSDSDAGLLMSFNENRTQILLLAQKRTKGPSRTLQEGRIAARHRNMGQYLSKSRSPGAGIGISGQLPSSSNDQTPRVPNAQVPMSEPINQTAESLNHSPNGTPISQASKTSKVEPLPLGKTRSNPNHDLEVTSMEQEAPGFMAWSPDRDSAQDGLTPSSAGNNGNDGSTTVNSEEDQTGLNYDDVWQGENKVTVPKCSSYPRD